MAEAIVAGEIIEAVKAVEATVAAIAVAIDSNFIKIKNKNNRIYI